MIGWIYILHFPFDEGDVGVVVAKRRFAALFVFVCQDTEATILG